MENVNSMDLNELKDIIQREGGKIIIVENGKPQMVVMAFEEWRRQPKSPQEQAPMPTPPPVDEENLRGITIDDLPL